MSLVDSLKTSAYYDDTRFNHLKVAVVKYLVNYGKCNGQTLLKNFTTLREDDLNIMAKYNIIHKKIMCMDDTYTASDWARNLIIPDNINPPLSIVKTDLDTIEINNDDNKVEQYTLNETLKDSYCKIT